MDEMDFSKLMNNMPAPTITVPQSVLDQTREIQAGMDIIARHNAKKDEALFATAKASIAQKKLLESQLDEVKKQNELLQKNYDLLNALYEKTKKEAEQADKDAKTSKVFGWVSFGVGTLIGIAGIVFGIIF